MVDASGDQRIGFPHLHVRRCGSTNDLARALAARGAPHGTLVTADEQTAGRGRQGRSWTAPPGSSLLASFLLRPQRPPSGLFALAVALATAEACEELVPGLEVGVKWPNDLVVAGRKLAGILIEGRPQESWLVVGIGVNVTLRPEQLAPELVDRATSLALEAERLGRRVPVPSELATALCTTLARWTEPSGLERVTAVWPSRDVLAGHAVRWSSGSGIAEGIDEQGRLRVRVGEQEITLAAGEVHLGTGEAPAETH